MNTASAAPVLWPDGAKGSTWALLDLARDGAIQAALLQSRLEFLCLYSGPLPRALETVAPHMVELPPGHRLADRLLGDGAGRSWGVFVRTADPVNLRHHLRKFLKVRSEAGRTLLFRYYDPRVLRAWLPTCRTDELRQFFGPVSAWLSETADGSNLTEWRFDGRSLLRDGSPVKAPA